MKRDCEMARDLMPLCVDGVASEGSQEFVAAHAASCRECAEVYRQMREALRSEQSPAQARAENDQAALRIRRHLRARVLRSVLLGLLIGLIVCLGGIRAYNYLASSYSRAKALDSYEVSAYTREANGRLVLAMRYQGEYSGYSTRREVEDGRAILYVTATQALLPRGGDSEAGSALIDAPEGIDAAEYDEIRQGKPGRYAVVWTRGEEAPACSDTLEAVLRNLEEQEHSAIVQNEYFSYEVGNLQPNETPRVYTEAEWHALLEEGARLRAAAPELQPDDD